MRYFSFAVVDDPYCVWEHDLPKRNDLFLSGLDPDYFPFIANTFAEGMEGEDAQRCAVGLRSAYYHGLETLFTLIGAFLQAPACVPGWIPKCRTESLRELVRRLNVGAPLLTAVGQRRLLWKGVASEVHMCAFPDDTPAGVTAERFGVLWSRLANDFLDPLLINEYNSLKHGFRVNAGGFTLRIGKEEAPGVPAPPSAMRSLGGSAYGSRLLVPEPVLPETSDHRRLHFRVRQRSLNWIPESMIGRLHLIGMSCGNVISGTRAITGVDPTTLKFLRPADPDSFDMPWKQSMGVTSSSMDLVVEAEDIEPFSKQEILDQIEKRGRQRDARQPTNSEPAEE